MAEIKYSPTEVNKAGNDFKQASTTLQQKVQNLQSQVANMRWESAPARAFRQRFETEWRYGLIQLYKALQDTGVSLNTVAGTYTTSDQQMEADVSQGKTFQTGYSR
jgi:WXG100 family type VII secretion target